MGFYGALKKSTIEILILSTAIISWIIVFIIGGNYVFKIILAVNYQVAILYSMPPAKLKIRKFWGFLANTLIERPLPILVLLSYMSYYTIETIVLPILIELTWSVFKHQAGDVREDAETGVTTFAVYLGEALSMKIVNLALNPLSVFSVLLLTGLSWLGILGLRLPLAIGFFVILAAVLVAFPAERQGKLRKYLTPTDPPYIMFLNLAFRFILLPILAFGILSELLEYYPLLVILCATLAYHAYSYSRLARQVF